MGSKVGAGCRVFDPDPEAALGTAALGTAALGTAALSTAALAHSALLHLQGLWSVDFCAAGDAKQNNLGIAQIPDGIQVGDCLVWMRIIPRGDVDAHRGAFLVAT